MENNPEWKNWINKYEHRQPFVIAGPCSAETEEQVMQTAAQLQEAKVSVFRAGIWKPRTRPGGFEGVGALGLKWLKRVKAEFGMPIAIEVATPVHVRLAIEHDIDILWVGARTTTNPFAVQELADELKNTDKIVLIKNPVNPDLSLWLGAVERFSKANITNLGVIHRGFSTYEKTMYRNLPEWQIPIELQTKYPDLPLICDPSHITGNRSMIAEVSQQALNLNYNGLIIETHIDPENAWSDAAQQVRPESLKNILNKLIVRKATESSQVYQQKLDSYRFQIDQLDVKLMHILGQRMQIAEQIGHLKKEFNVALFQTERWQAVQERLLAEGFSENVSQEFIIALYKAIHQESISRQEKVIQ